MKLTKKIHVWVPDLFSTTGGIQAFSRHFIKALSSQIAPYEVRLLIKNDLPEAVPRNGVFRGASAFGQWPPELRTVSFAMECLRCAMYERPSLIISTHLHFGPVAHIVRKLIGTPYILVAHGIEAWRLDNKYRRKALINADSVFAVSRYTRNWLIREINLDSQRAQILPNTFLPEQFTIRPKPPSLLKRYGLTPQTPVILTVSRLAERERYKGYDILLKAMPAIRRAIPDVHYVIVGKGPDRARIERLISDLDLRDHVTLAGFIPDHELCDYYNLSDVFAMPSKGEGFGIVFLEAMACGKPTLAGNKDGSSDALLWGELGALVDPDDVEEISSTLIGILNKTYWHPIFYNPELLRQKVVEAYGYDSFKQTLSYLLRDKLEPYFCNNRAQIFTK